MQELKSKGFALLRSYLPRLDTTTAISTLGDCIQLEGVEKVQILSPKKQEDSTPNTYSGIYGLQDFPLHTDLAHWKNPPRYLALRCIVGSMSVQTQLVQFSGVAERMGVCELKRLLIQPRRPINGSRSLLNVLEIKPNGQHLYRWDSVFVEPATTISTLMFYQLEKHIQDEKRIDVHLKDPGDTLIIDNWVMLHGRSPVPTEELTRRVERVYLNNIIGS